MISRKELEIVLTQNIDSFSNPKHQYEQYMTPPRVAANLIHWAVHRGDIIDKDVLDVAAGTGMLGIAAMLNGANVTFLEIDDEAISDLKQNLEHFQVHQTIITADIFNYEFQQKFDSVLVNPPFGIQQKHRRDLEFIEPLTEVTDTIYSIHDGSPKNIERLPELFQQIGLEIIEYYIDEFPLKKSYPWHSKITKLHHSMIICSKVL